MDSELKQMYFTYEYFRACFQEILAIVAYLNREIGVEKLPDSIRNRKDAYKAIEEWNQKVSKLHEYYYETFKFPKFSQFVVRFTTDDNEQKQLQKNL